MTIPTWETSKYLLADYDGSATELFLVGCPISELHVVVSVLSNLPALEVISFNNEALENSEPFDAGWRLRFQSMPSQNCLHSLRSANGSARHIQVYLWLDTSASLLELEIVFWNDMTFPHGLAIEEYERRLQSLCEIVERCRVGAPNAICMLAPEHNGPTAELEGKAHVFRW